jgi:hypothetical protein
MTGFQMVFRTDYGEREHVFSGVSSGHGVGVF